MADLKSTQTIVRTRQGWRQWHGPGKRPPGLYLGFNTYTGQNVKRHQFPADTDSSGTLDSALAAGASVGAQDVTGQPLRDRRRVSPLNTRIKVVEGDNQHVLLPHMEQLAAATQRNALVAERLEQRLDQ